jgi:molecular chaperone HscB
MSTDDAVTGADAAAGSTTRPAKLPPFDPGHDHFARLGLERAHRMDRDAFEDAYRRRAAEVHPDRYVTEPASVQRLALEHSSALNEAYRVLRDPIRRAEYLVKLAGIDLDSSDPRSGAPSPGQSFLIEMIERRERLSEHAEAGRLDEFRDSVADEREDALDGALDALERSDVASAASALVELRYLSRLIEEIDGAEAER